MTPAIDKFLRFPYIKLDLKWCSGRRGPVKKQHIVQVLIFVIALFAAVLTHVTQAGGPTAVLDAPAVRDFSWWPFDVSAPYSGVDDPCAATVIRLDAGAFDTRDGDMPLPEGLRSRPLAAGESGMYLVQLSGPVTESDKQSIRSLGCTLYDYIPNYAFVAVMSPETALSLETLKRVRWVGRYHPAWRIHSLFGRRGYRLLENIQSETVSIIVQALDSNALPDIARRIEDIDGEVIRIYADADPPILTAEILPESVFELAQMETVRRIEERGEYYTLNDETQEVLQSGWTASGTPVWAAGIFGEQQILGHMDSGVDPDHCFFNDATQPLPGSNPNYAHRKIIAYRTYAEGQAYDKCENGHGTHTAGTAAGDTYDPAGTAYIGMAPQAKITVGDVGKDDWLGCYLGYLSVPSNLATVYTDAYNDGARVHTNSWGSTDNTYDAMANQTDTFMWNHKDFLIFYANGNSGPDAGTMGTPATSKNIVAVGGCINEPDQNTVWSSSSRGPVNGSNRMAPALMAPSSDGTGMFGGIDSSASDGQTGSVTCDFVGPGYQGTSMACPAAAGCALLVRQYFEDGYYPTGSEIPGNGFIPTAALMKAVMINGAANMVDAAARPNNDQGWGRVHLDQSLYFTGDASRLIVHDITTGIATGGMHEYTVPVQSASEPLRITVVWTDAAGNFLVNDLDLELTHSGSTWYGNNFQNGWSSTATNRDRSLPTECIFLNENTFSPGQYIIRVRGHNVPSGEPGGLQPYALAVTGDITTGSPPTATPTPDPQATNTPVPSGTPTFTPTPDPNATNTPIPTYTPTPVCDTTGVTIEMPAHHFTPGDPCFLNLRFCNISQAPIPETPVFVILDVYGVMFFAPGWTESLDYYTLTVAPGKAVFPVLPQFNWPVGAGTASGLMFYAAITDPGFVHILGDYSTWELSWSE